MGQPTEQSRDDFKDVQEVEVLSYKNFQKKFCGEAFFGMSSFKNLNMSSLKFKTQKKVVMPCLINP